MTSQFPRFIQYFNLIYKPYLGLPHCHNNNFLAFFPPNAESKQGLHLVLNCQIFLVSFDLESFASSSSSPFLFFCPTDIAEASKPVTVPFSGFHRKRHLNSFYFLGNFLSIPLVSASIIWADLSTGLLHKPASVRGLEYLPQVDSLIPQILILTCPWFVS